MKYFYLIISFVFICSFNVFAAENNNESIKRAIRANDLASVENFINQSQNINERDDEGYTPLHYALLKNRLEIAKKLIDAGADINAPSSEDGMTPLLIATSRANKLQEKAQKIMERSEGDVENRVIVIKLKKYIAKQMNLARKMLEILIEAGADLNQETPFGTPLMNASTNSWNADIIDILIKSGANVNARDRNGRTALFYGEIFGGDSISTKLISYGADVSVKDNNDKTYMEITADDFNDN